MSKKCIAVHLPIELIDAIDEIKAKTGKSQSGVITELIEKGLGKIVPKSQDENLVYFVKVRINTHRMAEYGKKLQSGEIDTSSTIITFCDKNDPAVGLNFWQVVDNDEFNFKLNQNKPFYDEIIEILPVITPRQAMIELMNILSSIKNI